VVPSFLGFTFVSLFLLLTGFESSVFQASTTAESFESSIVECNCLAILALPTLFLFNFGDFSTGLGFTALTDSMFPPSETDEVELSARYRCGIRCDLNRLPYLNRVRLHSNRFRTHDGDRFWLIYLRLALIWWNRIVEFHQRRRAFITPSNNLF
jgi:hypothetical protein